MVLRLKSKIFNYLKQSISKPGDTNTVHNNRIIADPYWKLSFLCVMIHNSKGIR